MKKNLFFSRLLQAATVVVLWATAVLPARAQAPPGWAWARAFGGSTVASNENSAATSVGTDAAGNVYVLGGFVGTTDFGGTTATSAGETDVFLAKYTASGALVWVRVLSGTGVDQAGQLTVSPTGRCVISGLYGGLSGDNLNLPGGQVLLGPQQSGAPISLNTYGDFSYVASFNAQGTKEWAMRFSASYGAEMKSISLSPAGIAYVGGATRSALTTPGATGSPVGICDVFLASISPQGAVQWVRRAGVTGDWTGASAPLLDGAGNLYWYVGTTSPGTLVSDAQSYALPVPNGGCVLLKLTPQNRVVWARPSGGLVFIANNPGNYTDLVDYDPVLSSLWFTAGISAGNTVNFGGGVAPITAPANASATIIGRIDTSGAVTWATAWATGVASAQPAPPFPLNIQRILSGPGGSVTVVGQVNGDLALMNTGRVHTGQRGNLLVARFNPLATRDNWARFATINMGYSISYSNVTSAALDGQGNVYVTGTFPTRAQFGALAPLLPTRGGGWSDGFVAKLDMATITATRAGAQGLAWGMYPNPATGMVQLSGLPARATVQVLDVQGRRVREVQTGAAAGAGQRLSLTGLAAGLYTLRVTGAEESYRPQRLTVE